MAEEISPLENHGWWMEQLRKDAKANRPEALRLADALEDDLSELGVWGQDIADSAAAELRRLHALNGELLEALKMAMPTLERLKFEADCSYGRNFVKTRAETARRNYEVARAAIAKAEGGPK